MRCPSFTPAIGRWRLTLVGATLAVATALFGGVMAAPAMAVTGPSITLTPSAVQADHGTTISGTNFVPGDYVYISFDGTYLPGSGITVDQSGNFTANRQIPFDATVGMHTLTANEEALTFETPRQDPPASAQVYVNATGPGGAALHPVITIGDLTTPGKGQTVTLWGFFPGESVAGGFGAGQYGGPTNQTATADRNGSVTFTYVYPASTANGWTPTSGSYTFTMNGIGAQSGVNAVASFAVVPNPAPVVVVPTPVTTTPVPVPTKPVPVPVKPVTSKPVGSTSTSTSTHTVATVPATSAADAATVTLAPVATAVAGRASFTG